MPKMKSHSGMTDRIKVTGRGKLLRRQAHRKAGAAFASTPVQSSRYHRRHTGDVVVAKADTRRIKKLLGR
jgi:large subunit ribosomal protein L35